MEPSLIAILILSGIGIINTSYLLTHVFSKKPVACIFFPPKWCHKVQFSKFSKTFGVPNSITGWLMYVAIFILTLMFWLGWVTFWPIALLISIGFIFSLYFTAIQAFVLKAFCTWCVLSAIDFAVLMVIVWPRIF